MRGNQQFKLPRFLITSNIAHTPQTLFPIPSNNIPLLSIANKTHASKKMVLIYMMYASSRGKREAKKVTNQFPPEVEPKFCKEESKSCLSLAWKHLTLA